MNADAQASLDLVDRRDLIEIGSELVRFPSFKGDETPLARYLAEWLGARGYAVELDEVDPAGSR